MRSLILCETFSSKDWFRHWRTVSLESYILLFSFSLCFCLGRIRLFCFCPTHLFCMFYPFGGDRILPNTHFSADPIEIFFFYYLNSEKFFSNHSCSCCWHICYVTYHIRGSFRCRDWGTQRKTSTNDSDGCRPFYATVRKYFDIPKLVIDGDGEKEERESDSWARTYGWRNEEESHLHFFVFFQVCWCISPLRYDVHMICL